MFFREVASIAGTEQDGYGPGWRSRRLITADDGLDYSFHFTEVDEGSRLEFEYTNHRETVFCVDGLARVEDVSTGKIVELRPGSLYSVGTREPHVFSATTNMRLVCVFDPPLHGSEEAD
jgi:L-ectoine synthase